MIRYDKPIIKTAAEMKPGDICRVEYGDYGNWCELVFMCCSMSVPGCTMTVFHSYRQEGLKEILRIHRYKPCYIYGHRTRISIKEKAVTRTAIKQTKTLLQ